MPLVRQSRRLFLSRGDQVLGRYPHNGFLSLVHGSAYLIHQTFQMVLGVFKLRPLCPFSVLTIKPRRSIQGPSE